MLLLKRILPVALRMRFGWFVLISFLLPELTIQSGANQPFTLADLRSHFVDWAVVLAAFALVLGFLNLLGVHYRRIRHGQGVVFSLVLIVGALVTLGLWVGSLLQKAPPMVFLDRIFNLVIYPLQSALGALLAFVLALAGFRALRMRRSFGMLLFVLTAVVVVLTQPAALFGETLNPIRALLIDPITTGGVRGLLLGVALGSIAVGLRVLVGADKPQSD